jgi:broad specificity phosphatase PhoE
MAENSERHLVIVRHGESEGDVWRASRKIGLLNYSIVRDPARHEQTKRGHQQMVAVGSWLVRNVMEPHGINDFGLYFNSPLLRARQSARSLGLGDNWQDEPMLSDRDRGRFKMPPDEHKARFPKSYERMQKDPLRWKPPGGRTVASMIEDEIGRFKDKIDDYQSVLAVTHREWMWGSLVVFAGLSYDEASRYNTNQIDNGQTFEFTNLNPVSNEIEGYPYSYWRSVCPWQEKSKVETDANTWYGIAA